MLSRRSRLYAFAIIALNLVMLSLLVACASKQGKDDPDESTSIDPILVDDNKPVGGYYDYLGGIDYDSSIIAMVYEPMEGEDEPGIQYRRVTDLEGLLSSGQTDVMIYFYTHMSSDVQGVTAGVEDLAQGLNGQLLVISVDAMQEQAMTEQYQLQALPEFVIVKGGEVEGLFEGYKYEYWTMDDVSAWIESYGYTIDYDLL